jgi:hypothetical protein
MVTANAQRVREHRDRTRAGLRVFSFEFSVAEAQELLRGFLKPEEMHDMQALERGMKCLLTLCQIDEKELPT